MRYKWREEADVVVEEVEEDGGGDSGRLIEPYGIYPRNK